ncbi:MATE family efflux transporter [Enterobacter mori]
MQFKNKSLFMLALRGATLASKFLLITYLAKYSTFETLAEYSIIAVTVSYLLYVLGFDFYSYSSREIIKTTFHKSGGLLLNQFSFYVVMYLLSIPLIYLLKLYGIIDSNIIFIFYFLLISEHLAQEFMRLLVINNKAFLANLQLFIRSAAWIYIYIYYCYVSGNTSLKLLLLSWTGGNIIAIIFALMDLKNVEKKTLKRWRVDFIWIFKGVKVAIPLLCATLMLRGVFVSDRYILKFLSSTQELAIYSFFSNMANSLIAFVDAAVIMQFYPKLIAAYQGEQPTIYAQQLKKFKTRVIIVGGCVSLMLIFAIPLLCIHLGHKEYLESLLIFYILLASVFIYSYGLIYHYELYSRGKDSLILYATFISFILGVFAQYLLGMYLQGVGIAIGVLISSCILLATKLMCLNKVKRDKNEIYY